MLRCKFCVLWLVVFVCAPSHAFKTLADDPIVSEPDGRLISFEQDIAPILRTKCLECHGPENAKNDFRVDTADNFLEYVSPGDPLNSSLYTDYLITSDTDLRMPPSSSDHTLSKAELALISTWILEGANWSNNVQWQTSVPPAVIAPASTVTITSPPGLITRLWAFQGYFHPAAVHFPIALLSLGAFFVVIGWIWPHLGDQIPLVCLAIGAPAAVVTTMMGWSFAYEQGFGSWTRWDTTAEVFWHRWSAVIITLIALASSVFAWLAYRRKSLQLERAWKVGLLLAGILVGLVGHQGGELTYGEELYKRAFERLLPATTPDPIIVSQNP